MIITKEQLLEKSRLDYLDVYRFLANLYTKHPHIQFLAYDFDKAPDILRLFATWAGGGEDYLFVYQGEKDENIYIPLWFPQDHNNDIYFVENFRIIVGSY
jgi:hypothetical protein